MTRKLNQYGSLVRSCDTAIREGRSREAVKQLAQVTPSRVPREYRLPFAKICRRCGQYSLGLRLLSPHVNQAETRAHTDPANADEITEYAALLLRSGAASEAMKKLERVDADQTPEAYLIRAFVHFARWEFAPAIPVLERYLGCKLTPDSMLVGQSNLAFALSECGRFEHATRLAAENIQLAHELSHIHLRSYNHALLGQIHLEEGRFELADAVITLALAHSDGGSNSTQFFARKLRLLLEGLQGETIAPFDELRALATSSRQWNALREADLFSLKVRFEQTRFEHLYFGSPFVGFRELLKRVLGHEPERDSYTLGPKSPCFDLETAKIDGHESLRPAFKCHQLIEILLRDFYQPISVAGLHSALFPEEYFNVSTSPDRVHQILRRTRRWLEAESIPVSIVSDRDFYRLEITGAFSFRVPRERRPADPFHLQMKILTDTLSPPFSSAEIKAELGISTTAAHRLLHRALAAGEIEREGRAKRPALFKFATQIKKAG